MTGHPLRDEEGPTFRPRSVYWSCSACGALVSGEDRETHRRAHVVLARALRDAAG